MQAPTAVSDGAAHRWPAVALNLPAHRGPFRRHIHHHAQEAVVRIKVLSSAALLSAGVKWVDGFVWAIPRWARTAKLERLSSAVAGPV